MVLSLDHAVNIHASLVILADHLSNLLTHLSHCNHLSFVLLMPIRLLWHLYSIVILCMEWTRSHILWLQSYKHMRHLGQTVRHSTSETSLCMQKRSGQKQSCLLLGVAYDAAEIPKHQTADMQNRLQHESQQPWKPSAHCTVCPDT